MKKIKKIKEISEYIFQLSAIAVIAFLAFLTATDSPLNIWSEGDASTDSAVFKTVALYMQKGLMPYRDIFDHKGPLLYLINYLGNQLSYYRGIWVIELVFIFLTFYFGYLTFHLFTGRLNSIFLVALSASALLVFFEGGNLSEEYAMPFIAIALYYFIDYVENERVTKLRLFLCGFAFGAVVLLRINMVGIWVVFCIAILIKLYLKRDTYTAFVFVKWFSIGTLTIVVPIIIWLTFNGAMNDFIRDYFSFNMMYVEVNSIQRIISFISYYNNTAIKIAFMISLVLAVIKKDNLSIIFFVAFFANLILIALSGQVYFHYGMTVVPIIAVPIAMFVNSLEKAVKSRLLGTAFVVLLTVFVCNNCWSNKVSDIMKNVQGVADNNQYYSSTIVQIINDNKNENDLLSVYGNWDIIHVRTRLLSPSKYTFQYPVGVIDSRILNDYYRDIQSNPPRWLVVQYEYEDDRIQKFIADNGYELCLDKEENPVAMLYIKR